ncbi:MAG: hypothetical protein DI628_07380 [Blastochloris viridis]|uniref:Flagellar FliJ protein n=1 Tax=Blastochloris viridis TaxID=1079 RepID=A0A6N4RBV1_BLAVI|nr:MAG: hypothetical protein DI628_07380 [Blastochloris viridis]
MAETLEVLIKVAERKVETVQSALAKTREAIAACRERVKELEQEAAVAFVTAVAEDDVLSLQAAGAFQERVRREIAELKQMEEVLLEQEAVQQKQLQELYAQQKTYELLWEKKLMERRKERMKKAQNALDEVAGRIKS